MPNGSYGAERAVQGTTALDPARAGPLESGDLANNGAINCVVLARHGIWAWVMATSGPYSGEPLTFHIATLNRGEIV